MANPRNIVTFRVASRVSIGVIVRDYKQDGNGPPLIYELTTASETLHISLEDAQLLVAMRAAAGDNVA